MNKKLKVPLFDMIMCFSDAIDLVSQIVNGHHKRVAYIAASIAKEMGWSKEKQTDLVIAGALHDAGAFSLKERLDALNFEQSYHYEEIDACEHAESGYQLVKNFAPFSNIASLIRYHHVIWEERNETQLSSEPIPPASHLLHLADRVDVLINKNEEILDQKDKICKKIKGESGEMFMPELVEGFLSVAEKEVFWLDIVSPMLNQILAKKANQENIELNLERLRGLAILFSQIIDFRCEFTADHSSGVAATAEMLARLMGLTERECSMMEVAGYLHDLGKLAVPPEILNKPDKLTEHEFNIIKKHPFHTYRILERVQGLRKINVWASLHHERLDGTGYPFHYLEEELTLGSRIMAVADVFTAITEDRPYREGMSKEKALSVLKDMGQESALDLEIIAILQDNYDEINYTREVVQDREIKNYNNFPPEIC